jgi:segregation and condensation protein B
MNDGLEYRSVKDLLENLLFLSEEPLTLKHLSDSLPYPKEEISAALDALQTDFENRAIKLRFVQGGWILATDPSMHQEIEAFYDLQRRRRLSRAALETLAVIAYNQPVTRAEIEAVRGLQTSGTLQTLQEAALIRVIGQRESVGNPYLYGTTDEFLRYFGLADPSELPPLEFNHQHIPAEKEPVVEPGDECIEAAEGVADDIITPVDFGFSSESEEVTIHAQQKGA